MHGNDVDEMMNVTHEAIGMHASCCPTSKYGSWLDE